MIYPRYRTHYDACGVVSVRVVGYLSESATAKVSVYVPYTATESGPLLARLTTCVCSGKPTNQ